MLHYTTDPDERAFSAAMHAADEAFQSTHDFKLYSTVYQQVFAAAQHELKLETTNS